MDCFSDSEDEFEAEFKRNRQRDSNSDGVKEFRTILKSPDSDSAQNKCDWWGRQTNGSSEEGDPLNQSQDNCSFRIKQEETVKRGILDSDDTGKRNKEIIKHSNEPEIVVRLIPEKDTLKTLKNSASDSCAKKSNWLGKQSKEPSKQTESSPSLHTTDDAQPSATKDQVLKKRKRASNSFESFSAPNPFKTFAFGSAASSIDNQGSPTAQNPPAIQSFPGKKATVLTLKQEKVKLPKAKDNCLQAEHLETLSDKDKATLLEKWASIIGKTKADLETTRFQILVGAILSSRTRENVVREGLISLRRIEGGFSLATLSSLDQKDISKTLSFIHFNNNKSKYIKDSTKMIINRFQGTVPRLESHLKELPGIGSALARLLVILLNSNLALMLCDENLKSPISNTKSIPNSIKAHFRDT